MVSEEQLNTALRYIDKARGEGNRLLLGGERTLTETGGYYLEPTIFGGLAPTSTLAREEVFGPVLGVMTFKHGADAIRIANDTVYGPIGRASCREKSVSVRVSPGGRRYIKKQKN